MKRLYSITLFLFCGFMLTRADTLSFTLEDYMSKVLEQNQDLKTAWFKIEKAEAETESRRAVRPFKANASYDDKVSSSLPTDLADSLLPSLKDGTKTLTAQVSKDLITGSKVGVALGYNYNASNSNRIASALRSYHNSYVNFNLSQPLLSGVGNILHNRELRLATTDEQISRNEYERTAETIIIKAIETYFGLMQAKEQIRLKDNSVQFAKNRTNTISRLVDGGYETATSLLEHKLRMLELENELYSAYNDYQTKRNSFFELLNESGGSQEIVLTTVPKEPQTTDNTAMNEKLYSAALENREDYKAAALKVQKAELNLAVKKSSSLPDLQLTSNYYMYGTDPKFGRALENFGSFKYNSWSLGGKYSMTLGKNVRNKQLLPLQIGVKQARYQKESLERRIRQDLQSNIAALELSLKQYIASNDALELAEKNFSEAQSLYEKKYLSASKLDDLQKNREMAEYRTVVSKGQFTVNYYRLKFSQGKLLECFE